MARRLKPLDLIIQGVDRVTAPIAKINRKIESMRKPVRRVANAFRSLSREAGLSRIASAAGRVGREFGALARRAALFGGVMAGAGAAGIKRFIDTGDQIAKTASKLGVGVEALQELRFAADRSGIATQTFDMALQRFTRRAAEAAAGTGEAKDALRFLGVSLKDSTGKIRPAEDLLGDVADAMARIEDPALRVRIAFKLFDSEGVSMVNMLKGGKAELGALRREAQDLGAVMSEETARSAEVAQDRLTNLMAVVRGIAYTAGSELLPAISQTILELTSWAKANREVIRVRVVEFARTATEAVRQLRDFVVRTVPPTIRFIEAIGGLKTILAITAGIIGAKLIVSLVSLGSAVVGLAVRIPALVTGLKALNLAFLLNPIGLWIAGIAGVIAAGVLLVRHWDTVKQFFLGLWKRIGESPLKYFLPGLGPILLAVDTIKKAWGPLVDFFSGTTRAIAQKIAALADFLPGPVARFFGIEGGSAAPERRTVAPTPPAAAASRVSGELAVSVSTAPGLQSRVTRIESSRDLDLFADVGPAMSY